MEDCEVKEDSLPTAENAPDTCLQDSMSDFMKYTRQRSIEMRNLLLPNGSGAKALWH
jgi:hypothetical protein